MFRFSVLVLCFIVLGWNAADPQPLQPIAVSGPIEARVNIILTGDGFNESEVNSGVFDKKA